MTSPGDGLTELMTGPSLDARPRPGRLDAVTLLTCYVVLLLMIPGLYFLWRQSSRRAEFLVIASAIVGSPSVSCQVFVGICVVITVDERS